jgi:hypothetical protein
MAWRQALAKRFGAILPLSSGVSGEFTLPASRLAADPGKMPELRAFPHLARTMHKVRRSQWSSYRGAPFLVFGRRLPLNEKALRTGPAERFFV